LLQRFPRCKVIENSQYDQSLLIDQILSFVPEIGGHRNRLRSVYIELTKNRVFDNLCGRFRDKDLHLIGYEGPHMVAVSEKLLSTLYQQSLLDQCSVVCVEKKVARDLDEGTASFEVRGRAIPLVQFHTSTIGEIGDDQVWSGQFKKIGEPHIPFKGPECYRIIRFNFDDFSIIVRVEPQILGRHNLLRNANSIYRVVRGEIEQVGVFNLNIFSDAVMKNFERLSHGAFDVAKALEISCRRLSLLDQLARVYIDAPSSLPFQEEKEQEHEQRVDSGQYSAVRVDVGSVRDRGIEIVEQVIKRHSVRQVVNRLLYEKSKMVMPGPATTSVGT
jgi:hypothetical protein